MTSIKIYNQYGDLYYSNKELTSTDFPITDKCERSAKIMGDDYVRLVFDLYDKVVFNAFSFIVYNGQTFFLRERYIPSPNGTMQENGEISSLNYSYDVKFVSVANMLDKHVCYRHVIVNGGNAGEWYEPEININGTLETMYVIVLGAIKRVSEEYSNYYYGYLLSTLYDNCIEKVNGVEKPSANVKLTQGTKLLTFNFSGESIANVCTTIANNYTKDDKKDTEWYIEEVQVSRSVGNNMLRLHFAKCQSDKGEQLYSDYTFKNVGAGAELHPYVTGGLKKVEYAQAWSGVTNVIVPYGSDRNMTYQSAKGIDVITQMQSTFGKRLRLKPNFTYRFFDKDLNRIEVTTDANGALRNDMVDTGIEQVKFFDDIYPQGHFRITDVTERSKRQDGQTVPEYTIRAIPISSDGEEISKELLTENGFYPIKIEEGSTLSVRFEKGLLNGREFEVANKTTKDEGEDTYSLKLTIVADGSIEDGTLIPSGNFIPKIGDEFALFNMKMPQYYIDLAEEELVRRAYEELLNLQTTRPEVKCTTDPIVFNNNVCFGDVMRISSELFTTDNNEFVSRVIAYSYKLTKPNDVQFSLASAVMQGTLSSMNDMITDVTRQTGGLEQRAINLSRRAWRDASEVADMIDSITSEMMLVGNDKYQFAFTSGIECTEEGVHVGGGTIQHTQEPYINWGNNGFWAVNETVLSSDEDGTTLDANIAYYLYAKVGEEQKPAEIVLSTTDYKDNENYLLFGVLSSEFEGERVFSRTNGFTAIAGGTITTEQIQDAGRKLIIDFQSNPPRIIAREGAEIFGEFKFLNGDSVKSAIDSYDYLKQALNKGTTDIHGGLLMTNLLQLKDLDGNVAAGMSGIREDGILLWGGGTYQNAQDKNVTTYLAKDGTGKIGVFYVKKDNATVKTDDGKVVIDDTDGIGCYRPKDQDRAVVLVTPKELLPFEEMKKFGNKETASQSFNYDGGNTRVDVYGRPDGNYYGSEKTVEIGFIANGGTLKINGGAHAFYVNQKDEEEITLSGEYLICILKDSDGKEVSRHLLTYSDKTIYIDKSDSYSVTFMPAVYVSGTVKHQWEQDVLYQYHVGFDSIDTYFYYEKEYYTADRQTMVAYKGIFSYQNEFAYLYYKDGVGFDCYVENVRFSITKDGIKIDGLKDESQTQSGFLFKDSNGFVKVKS